MKKFLKLLLVAVASLGIFTACEETKEPTQPTPVFLPGEFHGQRSLAGYSPWGHKELDMTEQLIQSYPA